MISEYAGWQVGGGSLELGLKACDSRRRRGMEGVHCVHSSASWLGVWDEV